MKDKQQAMYTLVQHTGFSAAGKPAFEFAVEAVSIGTKAQAEAVTKAGGVLVEGYAEAERMEEYENYPPEVKGLCPRVRGRFARTRIHGYRVYVPPKND